MALQFSTTLRNAMMDQITSQVGASGRLKLYSGTKPSTCAAALSGNTLLVDLPCSATLAAAAASGVLTLNALTETDSVASATASFFRLTTSGGTCVAQGDVAVSGSDLNINTTTIVSGGPIRINSATFTAPGA
jgi:hypothetical protein